LSWQQINLCHAKDDCKSKHYRQPSQDRDQFVLFLFETTKVQNRAQHQEKQHGKDNLSAEPGGTEISDGVEGMEGPAKMKMRRQHGDNHGERDDQQRVP
jgi:hypothetical protein